MIRRPVWFADDVSRETLEKLSAFEALLIKWTKKINLVSRSTIDDVSSRHIWDSAQVYAPTTGVWTDLGSGGGLPGIVVAVLAQGRGDMLTTTLIESDQRKATFLRTCVRELDLDVKVIAERVEAVKPQCAQVVSARALADLDALLTLATPHLTEDGTCVFMKGATWRSEIAAAQKNWRFSCEATDSKTNPNAAILRIRDIERA